MQSIGTGSVRTGFGLLVLAAFSGSAHAAPSPKAGESICPGGQYTDNQSPVVSEYVLPGNRKLLVCGYHETERDFSPHASGSVLMSEFDVFEIGPDGSKTILISFGAVDEAIVAFDAKQNQLRVDSTLYIPFGPKRKSKAVAYKSVAFNCGGASCVKKDATCSFEPKSVPNFKKDVARAKAKSTSDAALLKYVQSSGAVIQKTLVEALKGDVQASRLIRKMKTIGADGEDAEAISKADAVIVDARGAGCSVVE